MVGNLNKIGKSSLVFRGSEIPGASAQKTLVFGITGLVVTSPTTETLNPKP